VVARAEACRNCRSFDDIGEAGQLGAPRADTESHHPHVVERGEHAKAGEGNLERGDASGRNGATNGRLRRVRVGVAERLRCQVGAGRVSAVQGGGRSA
jgi:hypothetical protein